MTNKDLLDAIGRLPQDLLDEGLPKKTAQAVDSDDAPEIRMTKQPEKKNIRLRMGAAVAAGCLLLNGAVIGGLVYANRQSQKNRAQSSIANEISEQKTETPGYVRDMQDYYTTVTGRECTVDFTGMGVDLDDSFELDDATAGQNVQIRMAGLVSDGLVFYTFFDVMEPDGYEIPGGFVSQTIQTLRVRRQATELLSCEPLREPVHEDGMTVTRYCARSFIVHAVDYSRKGDVEAVFEVWGGYHGAVQEPQVSSQAISLDFIPVPEAADVPDIRSGGCRLTQAAVTPLGVYFEGKGETPDAIGQTLTQAIPQEEFDEEYVLAAADGTSKPLTFMNGWNVQCDGYVAVLMNFAEPLGKDTPADSVIRIGETEIPVSDLSRYFSGAQPEPQIQQADNKPAYVKWMQTLYDTDYDFTGSGTDLDITWEDHGYRVHMTAAAGDAFRLYYFYDVYPLEGQRYEDDAASDGKRDEFFPTPIFGFYNEDGSSIDLTRRNGFRIGENPLRLSTETTDGQEVWHMFGRVTDMTGAGMHDCRIFTCLPTQVDELLEQDVQNVVWQGTVDITSVPEAVEIPNFIKAPVYHDLIATALPPYTKYAVTELGMVLISEGAEGIDVDEWLADENTNMSFDLSDEEWYCEAHYPGFSNVGMPIDWMNGDYSWMKYPVQSTFWNQGGNMVGGVVNFHFAKPLDIRPSMDFYLVLNGVALPVNQPLPDFITSDAQPAATETEPETTTATTQTTASSVLAVNIRAENVTPTGCDIVFTNDANSDVYFGRAFRLLNTDGTPISPLCEIEFTEEALELPAGGTRTEHYDWSNYYGNLKPGSYLFETRVGGTPFTAKFTVS